MAKRTKSWDSTKICAAGKKLSCLQEASFPIARITPDSPLFGNHLPMTTSCNREKRRLVSDRLRVSRSETKSYSLAWEKKDAGKEACSRLQRDLLTRCTATRSD